MDKKEINKVISITCEYFKVSVEDVLGINRKKNLVTCRTIISEILTEELELTRVKVGNIMNRDHSSVVHSLQVHKNRVFTKDLDYIEVYEDILNEFKGTASGDDEKAKYKEAILEIKKALEESKRQIIKAEYLINNL